MSGNQSSIPLVSSPFQFAQHGEAGTWFSELLPQTASVADDLCVIKSVHTEAINHGPAVTYVQTGSQLPGRPSIGAWLSYGLGSDNVSLPSFVVMVTKTKAVSRCSRGCGKRIPAVPSSGSAVPVGQESGAVPQQPGRHRRRQSTSNAQRVARPA
ncbi:MAG: DUF1501 domain-containing protein [Planctomycetaceae bacterium]